MGIFRKEVSDDPYVTRLNCYKPYCTKNLPVKDLMPIYHLNQDTKESP